jgi:hypothetical protein
MENRDPTSHSNPGGQPGGSQKPGQGGSQKGGGDDSQRGSDKPASRPTPSGVPNEGRKTEGHRGDQDFGSPRNQGDYKYKGGRQDTGGIPNPDDQDDSESAGSFRGTAQANDVDDEDGNHADGSRSNPDKDTNSIFRYPK